MSIRTIRLLMVIMMSCYFISCRSSFSPPDGSTITTIISLIIAICCIALCCYYKRKNDALEKQIEELQSGAGVNPMKKEDDNSADVYKKLIKAVYDEKLFADNHLDRGSFAAHMNLSRHALNKIISGNTEGLSFPQWINKIRMQLACDLLRNHPDKTVAEVAKEVGLTQNNFHRLFRARYGMTPNEYQQTYGINK